MQRLAASLGLCLLACSPPQPSTAPAPAPSVTPAPEPEPRPKRAYFEPNDLEDRGFNESELGFGFEPVDVDEIEDYVFDGARPTSVTVRESISPYLSTRSASLAAFSEDGGLLILTELSGQTQVHRVERPLGMREQLTFGAGNVAQAAFDPLDASAILFRSDLDGNERYAVSHLELDSRKLRALQVPGEYARTFALGRNGDILISSYSEDGGETLIHVLDANGSPPRELFRGPGAWTLGGTSPDGQQLVLREYVAVDEESLDLLDLGTGMRTRIAGGRRGEVYKSASFSHDGKSLDVLGNRGGEFISLWRVDLATDTWTELTPKRRWDIESVARLPGGKRVVVVSNEGGFSVISALDPVSKKLVEIANPLGVVRDLRFVDSHTVMATVSGSRAPADVFEFDVRNKKVERWTKSEVGGLLPEHFIEPTIVRVRSFDGLEVPALYYRPRGPGPFATVIYAHGGPEAQTRPSFKPFFQYLAAERGIAVVAPNIRGSTGYGLTYMGLDDGNKRMDAIADIGAVLDWIATQPDLVADRVAIAGVSYGGFVTLASLIAYGDRLVAGVDSLGVPDIEEFLLRTSDHRRPLRRREYGDERDEATLEWMREISPLRNANLINRPLFISHGVNDPRVPVELAQRLADEIRQNGGEVWMMIAQHEGHGTQGLDTRDEHLRRMATFLERYLLAPAREGETALDSEAEADGDTVEPAEELAEQEDEDEDELVGG